MSHGTRENETRSLEPLLLQFKSRTVLCMLAASRRNHFYRLDGLACAVRTVSKTENFLTLTIELYCNKGTSSRCSFCFKFWMEKPVPTASTCPFRAG